MQKFEHALQPSVSYFILPLFALTNAGVFLKDIDFASTFGSPVTLGIMLGLVFGKVIGVFSFTGLSTKLRIAELPAGIKLKNIFGVSWLCGIGFTMSLFVASLAFKNSAVTVDAKIGIFSASIIAGAIGYIVLNKQLADR